MKIIKRTGEVVDFNKQKIIDAITKANNEVDVHARISKYLINAIASEIEDDCKAVIEDVTVEMVQDMVETALIKYGAAVVARTYITYREQHARNRNSNENLIDYKATIDKYLKVEDWRVKENATVPYSLGGLILSNSGAITANYWLSEIYDKDIADAHRNADIHIHDLSMLSPYCAGWSLKQLLLEGLGGVTGKITSKPAKHLAQLCNQMVNFIGIMQNEWAG